MDGDESLEFWQHLVKLLRQEPINRVVFTLVGGTKFIVQDVMSITCDPSALHIYLADGSVQLIQVATIACADVAFDAED